MDVPWFVFLTGKQGETNFNLPTRVNVRQEEDKYHISVFLEMFYVLNRKHNIFPMFIELLCTLTCHHIAWTHCYMLYCVWCTFILPTQWCVVFYPNKNIHVTKTSYNLRDTFFLNRKSISRTIWKNIIFKAPIPYFI